ncbi:PREDICTED: baculoviral IAP repeat-containing protein 5.1-like [Crocodylus porosus]|uniref:baculoviral IAP repeat-containing protein 5.1-like n=1 Tax=Crocodylus porosus TaxID=8502 RepID=UPI0009400DDC|nr:PREDICTED: baculoviral IAP repeat-containing protein 5.1-like [Crocodylus porosus]
MEAFLKELSLASKHLIEFRDMYDYANRVKTFKTWPFMGNCKCTPETMAKAGFIHCPNENEPDVAKCFFCLIELEGWEPNDDPWLEHTKRPSNCGFLSLTKSFDDLTVEEYYLLEMDRLRTFLCKTGRSTIWSFEKEVAATRKRLLDHFVSKHQYTPEPELPVPPHAASPDQAPESPNIDQHKPQHSNECKS